MIHSLFILNRNGDILIAKNCRGFVDRSIAYEFWNEVARAKKPEDVCPVISTLRHCLVHVRRDELTFLAVIQHDSPPLLVISFLDRIYTVFQVYLSNKVNEGSVKENFAIIYQVLEEMMDNGAPFTTEPNLLTEMIHPPGGLIGAAEDLITGKTGASSQLPGMMLRSTPWRNPKKHLQNEIFFDIIEDVDCIVDANGMLVSSDVRGTIMADCNLSGMPDLTMHFNYPRILDDVGFHPCVRLLRWAESSVISFVPPDGIFKLLDYRVPRGTTVNMPIYVKPQFSFHQGAGQVTVMVGTKQTQGKDVTNTVVYIPFSDEVSSVSFTVTHGETFYDSTKRLCTWTIGNLPNDKAPMLTGQILLGGGKQSLVSRPTITADFQVKGLSCSGIKVTTLGVTNVDYSLYKGCRHLCRAGRFQVRSL